MKKAKDFVKEDPSLPSAERFLARYKNYSDYYILLLCIVGAAVAVAVGIALFSNVLLGVALAVFGAVVYVVCSADEVKKQLGVSISHIRGGVHIKRATAVYGEAFVVPTRLEFARVTHILDGAFDSEKNDGLEKVFIPVGITYIGERVFGDRDALPEIRFEGTEEQWRDIENHTDFSGAVIFFGVPCPKPPKTKRKKDKGVSDV